MIYHVNEVFLTTPLALNNNMSVRACVWTGKKMSESQEKRGSGPIVCED